MSATSQYGANTDANNDPSQKGGSLGKKEARRDQWNVPGGLIDPGVLAKYNDWVRRQPLLAMVGSLVFIVLLGVFESLRDDWSILP